MEWSKTLGPDNGMETTLAEEIFTIRQIVMMKKILFKKAKLGIKKIRLLMLISKMFTWHYVVKNAP